MAADSLSNHVTIIYAHNEGHPGKSFFYDNSVSVRIIATSWGAHIIANPCSQQNSGR